MLYNLQAHPIVIQINEATPNVAHHQFFFLNVSDIPKPVGRTQHSKNNAAAVQKGASNSPIS